jgi:hypothetical protein
LLRLCTLVLAEEANRRRALGLRRGAALAATKIVPHLRSFAEVQDLIEPPPFARKLWHGRGTRELHRSIFAASLSVANQTKAEDPPIDHN